LIKYQFENFEGLGRNYSKKLNKLGLKSLQDLVFHLPSRYIDRTKITPIGSLQPQTDVVLEGEIRASEVVFGRRRSLVCKLQDGTGTTVLRFFHFSRAQQERLKPGAKLRCFGEVRPRQIWPRTLPSRISAPRCGQPHRIYRIR
jgi:ATP-dependent DNA helicase RecG